MGAVLWGSSDPDGALDAFRSALRLNPRDASAANNMGIIRLAAGDPAGAEGFFRQALEIDPGSHAARRNLGVAQRQRRRADKDEAEVKEKQCPELMRVLRKPSAKYYGSPKKIFPTV